MKNNSWRDTLTKYLKNWKWFLLSIFTFIFLAFLYVRYATPNFQIQAKIKILDEKSGASELANFKELDLFAGSEKKVEDEIEILNSRSNFIEVARRLRLNRSLYEIGDVKKAELYKNLPIVINFLNTPDSVIYISNFSFYIEIQGDNNFMFYENDKETQKAYQFGENISTSLGKIIITPDLENLKYNIGKKYLYSISPLTETAQSYKRNVAISKVDKFSNVLILSMLNPIEQKGIDILNALMDVYNENAVIDKKTIADKTSKFIDERITEIRSTLSIADDSAQEFKTSRGLADISSQANVNISIGAENQRELENVNNQLQIASYMKDFVETESGYEVLPSNIGLSDPSIVNNTLKYNQLVQQRNRLLKSSNEKNPIIENIDSELSSLKSSLKSSLNNVENSLSLTLNNLSNQQSRINSRIYSAPSNQRALRDITRKQETTESLYLYLLQKREEAQISAASAAPKSKIIDFAYLTSKAPVSPKKGLIYVGFFLFGVLIPFGAIYLNDIIDNKIHNKESLEKIVSDYPILAELPRLSKKQDKFLKNNDRSVLGESLRILRTNLDYLLNTKRTNRSEFNNVIFVTSSISGEGKTFVASNLAMVYATANKKVLLIGADIRNPKIHTFFVDKHSDIKGIAKERKKVGLTSYLNSDNVTLNDITTPLTLYNNDIDIIYSGEVPPNPAELMLSSKYDDLFKKVCARYDYVIVDTAPLMLVTDTLLISKYANQTIYVTRAGSTETRVVDYPISLQKEGKINGLAFVVNDVKNNNLGYGKKYGYGYGVKKKKWWQT